MYIIYFCQLQLIVDVVTKYLWLNNFAESFVYFLKHSQDLAEDLYWQALESVAL